MSYVFLFMGWYTLYNIYFSDKILALKYLSATHSYCCLMWTKSLKVKKKKRRKRKRKTRGFFCRKSLTQIAVHLSTKLITQLNILRGQTTGALNLSCWLVVVSGAYVLQNCICKCKMLYIIFLEVTKISWEDTAMPFIIHSAKKSMIFQTERNLPTRLKDVWENKETS